MNATAGIRTRVTSVAGTYHTTKLLSHKNDIIDFIGCERSEHEGLFCEAKNVALCVSNERNHLYGPTRIRTGDLRRVKATS